MAKPQELFKKLSSTLENDRELFITPSLTSEGIQPHSFIAYLQDENGEWEETTVTGQIPVTLDPSGIRTLQIFWERQSFPKPDPRIKRNIGEPHRGYWVYIYPNSGKPRIEFIDSFLPIEEKFMHGWMQRYLIRNEIEINGRWNYYCKLEENLEHRESIPQINWNQNRDRLIDKQCLELLYYCLNNITSKWESDPRHKWAGVKYLFDWILWSLGHPCCVEFPIENDYNPEPGVKEEGIWDGEANNRLLQIFDTNYFLLGKNDYFGEFLHTLSDKQLNFPKPKSFEAIDEFFKRQNFSEAEDNLQLFVDPVLDTGRTLMVASNYSLSLLGIQDANKDDLVTKAALINFYLFVPWAIKPSDLVNTEESTGLTNAQRIKSCFDNLIPVTLKNLYDLPENHFDTVLKVVDKKEYYPVVLVSFEDSSVKPRLVDLLSPSPQTEEKKTGIPSSDRSNFHSLLGSKKSDRKFDELLPPKQTKSLQLSSGKLDNLLPPKQTNTENLDNLLAPSKQSSPTGKLDDLLSRSQPNLNEILPELPSQISQSDNSKYLLESSKDKKVNDLFGNSIHRQETLELIEDVSTNNSFTPKELSFEEDES